MAHHWIFINSEGYRRFIAASKERPWLLYSGGTLLAGLSMVAGYLTMTATNPDLEMEGFQQRKRAELEKLPMDAQVVARSNREVLRAMLMDVAEGKDQARYTSLLDGKIHNTRHGTSMPDAPPK